MMEIGKDQFRLGLAVSGRNNNKTKQNKKNLPKYQSLKPERILFLLQVKEVCRPGVYGSVKMTEFFSVLWLHHPGYMALCLVVQAGCLTTYYHVVIQPVGRRKDTHISLPLRTLSRNHT